MHSCTSTKDLTLCQRVTTQTISAMHARCYLTNGIQASYICLTPFVDSKAAHHMMHGWCDLHHLFADIDPDLHMFGKHIRHQLLSLALFPVGDIQVYSPVLGAASFLNLLVDSACHFIASGQFHTLRLIPLHEPLTELVLENTAIAAYLLCDQRSALLSRKSHAGWMKLNHFHIYQFSTHIQGPCIALTRIARRIGVNLVHIPTTTRGHNCRLRLHYFIGIRLIGDKKCTYYPVVLFEQTCDIVIFQERDVQAVYFCQ